MKRERKARQEGQTLNTMDTLGAEIMERFWDALNAGEYQALDQIVAADYVDHFPQSCITTVGREGVKQTFRLQHLGLAQPRYIVESTLREDDMIATRFTVSDVGASNLREMFPSALRFELHGLYLYRIDRGHIIEGGALFDDLPLLQLALESVARSA
jgi:hypothetical protein